MYGDHSPRRDGPIRHFINWQTHAISKADLTPWGAPLLRFLNGRNIMINARDVHEPEDERLPEEDEEVDTGNDDIESEQDDEEEFDEEGGDD
jgi:hypothetical protein